MSRIICCQICGVVQGPEVIEGCYANAAKHGLEHLLAKLPMTHGDFAHIWIEQRLRHEVYGASWGPEPCRCGKPVHELAIEREDCRKRLVEPGQ